MPAKKPSRRSSVSVKTTAVKKRVVKKTSKKTAKKVVKKVTKRAAVRKPVTRKKIVKKTVKRISRAQKKAAEAQTVREARMYGHKNTMPTAANAPGRVLGKVITLAALGSLRVPIDGDAVAISIARVAGVGCMLLGLGLSWHISNQLFVMPAYTQSAQVISALPEEPTVSFDVAVEAPLPKHTPVIVSALADQVSLWIKSGTSSPQVVAMMERRGVATFGATIDTTQFADEAIQFMAAVHTADTVTFVADSQTYQVAPVVAALTTASSSAILQLPATTTDTGATPTTLYTPHVVGVVTYEDTAILYGTSSPNTTVELVALGVGLQKEMLVNDTGWWQYSTSSAVFGTAAYELYAVADQTNISEMYHLASTITTTPIVSSTTPEPNPHYFMLLWYLVAAIATVGVGAVLLLIGHHRHHECRHEKTLVTVA